MKKYLLTRQKEDYPGLDERTLMSLVGEDEYNQPPLANVAPSLPVVPQAHHTATFPISAQCDYDLSPTSVRLQLPLHKYNNGAYSPTSGYNSLTSLLNGHNTTTQVATPPAFNSHTPNAPTAASIGSAFMCPTAASVQSNTLNSLMALPSSPISQLERLGPQILRSQPSSVGMKQIPHNDFTDLQRYSQVHPLEWSMDDVIAWMLATARKHHIPHEALSITSFVGLTGPLMMFMNQQSFVDRDRRYGYLFYKEFRKLVGDDSNLLDDWMHVYGEQEAMCSAGGTQVKQEPSVSQASVNPSLSSLINNSLLHPHSSSDHVLHPGTSTASYDRKFDGGLTSSTARRLDSKNPDALLDSMPPLLSMASKMQQHKQQQQQLQQQQQQQQQQHHQQQQHFQQQQQQKRSSLGGLAPLAGSSASSNGLLGAPTPLKQRKRSQHTKGNKLWEFIRDALKDPNTCPSVVRWEDQEQGVFRIVESEKLARMWGDKKNNQKMTYEKLSRAMRTYYDKQILSPVPKTGMYPKKLVYKFGPLAHGWRADGGPLPMGVGAVANVVKPIAPNEDSHSHSNLSDHLAATNALAASMRQQQLQLHHQQQQQQQKQQQQQQQQHQQQHQHHHNMLLPQRPGSAIARLSHGGGGDLTSSHLSAFTGSNHVKLEAHQDDEDDDDDEEE